jgi:hypothetical protein
MTFKLLALDLDGTLVADMHTISPRTQAAVKAATQQGVQVVLATGRELTATQKFIDMLGLSTPVICYQGALVSNPLTGETIASQTLPLPLTHHLIDLARSYRLSLHLYLNGSTYTERPWPQSRSVLGELGAPIVQVEDLKASITTPPIKGLIVHPAEEAEVMVARLQADLGDKLSVFRSLDVLIEVTTPQVSKGQALALLAEHYGLSQAEVMAIGDQDNDVEMIAWAGLGVAMGNGSDRSKAAADVVAPPISEDGAAWAIERFILENDD